MPDRSRRSRRATSQASFSFTPSEASACGAMPSDSPAGPTTPPSGPAVAPASLSPKPPAPSEGLLTSATSGPSGSSSFDSAVLQSSLASRLRALTASRGSTLFRLIWKERVTPSGRAICALRGSALRTFDNDSTSPGFDEMLAPAKTPPAPWNTPIVSDMKRGVGGLSTEARLAAWATPVKEDGRSSRRHGYMIKGNLGTTLYDAALLTLPIDPDLATGSGPDASGSGVDPGPVVVEAAGVLLNPAHSRWLMGLPRAWDDCAPLPIKSPRRRRARSAPPSPDGSGG